jgi:hypothetical protein
MKQIVPTHREDWKTYFHRLTKILLRKKSPYCAIHRERILFRLLVPAAFSGIVPNFRGLCQGLPARRFPLLLDFHILAMAFLFLPGSAAGRPQTQFLDPPADNFTCDNLVVILPDLAPLDGTGSYSEQADNGVRRPGTIPAKKMIRAG